MCWCVGFLLGVLYGIIGLALFGGSLIVFISAVVMLAAIDVWMFFDYDVFCVVVAIGIASLCYFVTWCIAYFFPQRRGRKARIIGGRRYKNPARRKRNRDKVGYTWHKYVLSIFFANHFQYLRIWVVAVAHARLEDW